MEARDEVSSRRDMGENLEGRLHDTDGSEAHHYRMDAAQYRAESRADRTLSKDDRSQLAEEDDSRS